MDHAASGGRGHRVTRRQLLRAGLGLGLAGVPLLVAACQQQPAEPSPAQEVIKEVTKVVEKEVEKEVTKVVEKEVERVVTATPAPVSAAPATIELQFCDWQKGSAEMYQEAAKKCESENANLKVVLSYVPWAEIRPVTLAKLAAGNAPDIFHFDSFHDHEWGGYGALADHKPYVEPTMGEFVEGAFEEITNDKGEILGIPIRRAGEPSFFYRLDHMQEVGITPPATDKPWNWDEALDAALKLTDASKNRWGWIERGNVKGIFIKHFPWYLWANGGDIVQQVEKDGKKVWKSGFDLPETQEAYHFYVDLVLKHKVRPSDIVGFGYAEALAGFGKGAFSMLSMGHWFAGGLKTDYPDVKYGEQYGVTMLPVPPGKPPIQPMGFHYYSITAQSKNKDAAWLVMGYYIEPETMRKLAVNEFDQYPTLQSLLNDDYYQKDPFRSAFLGMLKYSRPYTPLTQYTPIIEAIVAPKTHEVIMGTADPEAAIAEMDRKINAELKWRG